jgi:hypothetical protein
MHKKEKAEGGKEDIEGGRCGREKYRKREKQ